MSTGAERLVNLFVTGSLYESTGSDRGNSSKFTMWVEEKEREGQKFGLHEEDGVESTVRELTVFLTSRHFPCESQSGTTRGYLATIVGADYLAFRVLKSIISTATEGTRQDNVEAESEQGGSK